jgi:hypothetical protein
VARYPDQNQPSFNEILNHLGAIDFKLTNSARFLIIVAQLVDKTAV